MTGLRALVAMAGVYIIFAGLLFISQSRYVYYPQRVLLADPGRIGLDFESVRFETTDGVRLSGWFIPGDSAGGVVLFCHGNAGNISHRLESIQIFHRLGLGVFIFDYRGYGESEGEPTEQGTYDDAEAAWRYLVEERQVAPSQIIVFGRSLGGAVAAWLAQRHTPGMLILESTFTSLGDVAATLYPYLPVRLLLRYEYDTAEYLDGVDSPVLIVHSRDDEIMPFAHGRRLFDTAPEPKRFLEIWGTHNEGFITSGKHYEEGLKAFISEHMALRKSVWRSRIERHVSFWELHLVGKCWIRAWYEFSKVGHAEQLPNFALRRKNPLHLSSVCLSLPGYHNDYLSDSCVFSLQNLAFCSIGDKKVPLSRVEPLL